MKKRKNGSFSVAPVLESGKSMTIPKKPIGFDGRYQELIAAVGFFVAATVFWTWPLTAKLSGFVVGDFGDNLHFAWMIGWFEKALLGLHVLPYHVPQLNYPAGWDLARSEIPATLVVPVVPFASAINPIFAYNLAIVLSFVLTGVATYLWVRQLGAGLAAGVVAGFAFAFDPFRIAHFRAGHLNILATMWFPICFMGLFALLVGRRTTKGLALSAGVGFGLISLSSQYYFYLTGIITLALIAGFFLFVDRQRLADRDFWKGAGWFSVGAVPLSLLGLLPYFSLISKGGLRERSVYAVASGSASITDFLLPSTDHFLWGSWVGQHFSREHWIEGSLYLGLAVTILAVIGWLSLWRRGDRKLAWLFLGLSALSLVIALGPYLHWNEELVSVNLPAALANRLGQNSIAVRLPGYYLFKAIPFYDLMRTFKRAAALMLLAVSVLSGIGLDSIIRRSGRLNPSLIAVTAFLLIALDFYPGTFERWSKVEPRPVDLWLAEQPGQGAVAQFPFYLEQDQLHVYYTLYNGKPFLGGFFNAYPPEQYQRIKPVMETFPSGESISILVNLGVKYVLVDGGAFADPDGVARSIQAHGLVSQGAFGSEWVYLLDDSP